MASNYTNASPSDIPLEQVKFIKMLNKIIGTTLKTQRCYKCMDYFSKNEIYSCESCLSKYRTKCLLVLFVKKCKYQLLLCKWDYFCSSACFEMSNNNRECNDFVKNESSKYKN